MVESASGSRLAVDIGGTFTDVVLDVNGVQTTAKVLTTYDDPANGVMQAISQVLAVASCPAESIRLILHGTTLATNALIERRGARTALLTTQGHRDALEMASENRFEQYDVNIDRPVPLVPRKWRLPIAERLNSRGEVLLALDEASVGRAIRQLEDHNIESVAVGLLHAYINPAHEEAIAQRLAADLPGLSVTLASDVCPEIREFERLSTACANAYVKPLMAGYLTSLQTQLGRAGLRASVLMMTSGGGLTSLTTAMRFPIRLVESGPAGGAILAAHLARELNLASVLSFDMGGTTAKICMIDDAQPLLSRSFEVDRVYRFKKGSGLPLRIPVIEMVEIGAGGGSIAAVDRLSRITVGPQSAGSEPGPAAYGRGGTRPAVTDADVVLGRVLPENFAGGSMQLDGAAAHRAVDAHVGGVLGQTTLSAAVGITEVVDENMTAAARAHAVEWGKDVAGRDMIAYGGAGPLHACGLAAKLKIKRILIPTGAGVGSAIGFLLAPVRYEVVRSRYQRLDSLDLQAVEVWFEEMRSEARAIVREAAPDSDLVEDRRAYMRYVGQGYEIAVEVASNLSAQALQQAFEDRYALLYGRVIPEVPIEILSWTLSLASVSESPDQPHSSVVERRLDAIRWVPVYDTSQQNVVQAGWFERDGLKPGDRLAGPALVVESQTTTVVDSAFDLRVLNNGQMLLERKAQT